MNKHAVTQAQLKRALAVAAEAGLSVAGLRNYPDGRVDVLFGQPLTPEPVPAVDDGSWEAHAKRHGYDRA